MKQYAFTMVSFAVIFFITRTATNMMSTLFMPVGSGNAWEAAGQHSSQVVVYDSFSVLSLTISLVVALGVSYFIYSRFAKRAD